MFKKWIILMVICCLSQFTQAQAGLLDSTFGNFGRVTLSQNSVINYGGILAALPDGKIMVFSSKLLPNEIQQTTLTRLLPDGAIDENFGNQGELIPDILAEELNISDAAVTTDGKIVAVGTIFSNDNYGIIILKFEQDGTFDESFGNGGYRIFNIGEEALLYSVKIKSDGKIITCGFIDNLLGDSIDGLLIQLLANGSDDESFGSVGLIRTDLFSSFEGFFGLDVQADGKIVASGTFGEDDLEMMAARFLPDGTLDNSFGDNGVIKFATPNFIEIGFDVIVQADQKITILAHNTDLQEEQSNFSLFRFNQNGDFDATFGDNGRVTKNIAFVLGSNKLLQQADGKYLVGGTSNIDGFNGEGFSWVFRYQADGSNDETFGLLGAYTSAPILNTPEGVDMILQADNKILVGTSQEQIIVTRLQADAIISTKTPDQIEFNLAIVPNPMQETAILTWTMEHNAAVACDLLDVQGRVVQSIFQKEDFYEGKQQRSISWKKDLPTGSYYLKMQIGNQTTTLPLLKGGQ
jgi:uncharacterized delta-60 repeat protein